MHLQRRSGTMLLVSSPMPFTLFGSLDSGVQIALAALVRSSDGLRVSRDGQARSSTPYPKSTDLERALKPSFEQAGFLHHHDLQHPKTGDRFEYDFWRNEDGVAMEIMGYRADDEVYKDILKFHVHDGTHVGVVWVPRWKWISGRRTETNFRATMKALAFADSFMSITALVAVVYDWEDEQQGVWRLAIIDGGGPSA